MNPDPKPVQGVARPLRTLGSRTITGASMCGRIVETGPEKDLASHFELSTSASPFNMTEAGDVQPSSSYPDMSGSGYDSREPYRYQDKDHVGDYKGPSNLTQSRTTSGNKANEGNGYDAASRRATYYERALHYDAPGSQSNPESPDPAPKRASPCTGLYYPEYTGPDAETKSRDHERRYSTIDPPSVKAKPHKIQSQILYSRPPMASLHPGEYAVDDDPTAQPLKKQPSRRSPAFYQSQYRVSVAPSYQVDDYAHDFEPRDEQEDGRGRAVERDRETRDEDKPARIRRHKGTLDDVVK
ncbi:hypothetical protein DL764_007155 [Monosporascus ibericus]|uniref:Uncharacterized protein n=1 Tax=Monosporascus ibericus TaxID=155417 RepID=A0A4Q4T546_9PEZI|nr:hypothetical protein DL764_007155 [Monosporascus ibericus]